MRRIYVYVCRAFLCRAGSDTSASAFNRDLHIVATNNMQNKRNTVKIVMYRKQKCMEFEYDKSRKPLL